MHKAAHILPPYGSKPTTALLHNSANKHTITSSKGPAIHRPCITILRFDLCGKSASTRAIRCRDFFWAFSFNRLDAGMSIEWARRIRGLFAPECIERYIVHHSACGAMCESSLEIKSWRIGAWTMAVSFLDKRYGQTHAI